MQRGTKQSEEARKAISTRMRKHWRATSKEKRSENAKRGWKTRRKNV